MSCTKIMKRVSESTDPCGTPVGKRLFVDGVSLWTVLACVSVGKVNTDFLYYVLMFVRFIFCLSSVLGTVSNPLLMPTVAISVR